MYKETKERNKMKASKRVKGKSDDGIGYSDKYLYIGEE